MADTPAVCVTVIACGGDLLERFGGWFAPVCRADIHTVDLSTTIRGRPPVEADGEYKIGQSDSVNVVGDASPGRMMPAQMKYSAPLTSPPVAPAFHENAPAPSVGSLPPPAEIWNVSTPGFAAQFVVAGDDAEASPAPPK